MKLKFYGTRGSIPVCDPGFQQFGGNTTCLQITFTDTNRIAIAIVKTAWERVGPRSNTLLLRTQYDL